LVDGLPVGLQVIGPLFGDLPVLHACRAYEAARGVSWPTPDLTTRLGEICHLGRGHARQQEQAVDEASLVFCPKIKVESLRLGGIFACD